MRLDNVAYRLGFGESRNQARQVVHHGHITVNSRKVNIPSYIVRPGDVVAWHLTSTKSEAFAMAKDAISNKHIPAWLSLDMDNMVGRIIRAPEREDIDSKVVEQSIVDYYSR